MSDNDTSLCDQCAMDVPASDTRTCECGAQICDDCWILHQSACKEASK